jgi:hypothetical protein
MYEPAFVSLRINRMKRGPSGRSKRPLLLWASALWLLGLGATDLWKSITLWQTRRLLAELGSTLSPTASAILALAWTLAGASLIAGGAGLWVRREWARHVARAAIVAHFTLIQAYTWGFVRTGLLWERRWINLVLASLAAGLSLTALTWKRCRGWLGLHSTEGPSTTT